jgi:excisionase family DNA binding protein
MPSDLMTLEEVCAELKRAVSIQTLRRKIKNGELRAVKPGRKFLVRRAWLEEMIEHGSTSWAEHESTNTSSATSGSVDDPAARRGTSSGTTGRQVALSDFQRAQRILRKPAGS